MKKVVDFVDDQMVIRSRQWLLSRRDQENPGKFLMNQKALDTFGRST
jgi:hypothetical protein